VKSWERNQVNSQLSQVRVQLTGESDAACDSGHSSGHQMVQVSVCGGGEFQCSEANIVKSFVINDHALIGVFNQLMDGQGGVVGFNDCVRDLG
jgi:hypothetical protein